jgi:2-phosphoglycerate kinase
MPKAYLIGGAPRVGKSHLVLRVIRQHPMFAISADSVRDLLQAALKPSAAPALFELRDISRQESAISELLKRHPRKAVTLQNDESNIVWPAINALIKSYLEDGQDILVEGVEILPEYLTDINYSHNAIFLGNTSKEHSNEMAIQAHKNSHDWLRKYTDGTIEDWAGLVRRFSRYVEHEANLKGMHYVETNDANFEESMSAAEQLLLM